MIVYRDMAFCMQDCGNNLCTRNKDNIPWETDLPVSFIRCEDCANWESKRFEKMTDYYVKED